MTYDNAMDVEHLQASVLARYSSKEDVETYQRRSQQGLREWERSIVERFMVPTSVLSIGCGAGRESFALENLGYHAYGIDITNEQIESANNVKHQRGSAATFTLFDGGDLPFAEAFFGAVTLWSQVLGNVPGSQQRLALLRECFRVLEPDGLMSISVHDREKSMRLLEAAGSTFTKVEGGESGDLLLDTQAGVPCFWHYFTKQEIRDLCREAGFSILLEASSDELGQAWDNLNIVVAKK